MPPKKAEKPLTLSELIQFYQQVIKPEMAEQMADKLREYHQHTAKPEMLSMMNHFYYKVIKPDVHSLVLREVGGLREEVLGGFGDLYKKFEDLKQEYVFANEQLKRIEKSL